MTRPTEDEIEKAAEADCDKQAEELPYKSEFERAAYEVTFISGARWALEQCKTLKWKRPEEELPEEDVNVIMLCEAIGVSNAPVRWLEFGTWFDASAHDYQIRAWARISLPEWLEEK